VNPLKILVADDEPAIRALVAKIIERSGLVVDTAGDGVEAIEMIDRNDYAVIVIDLMMPRVDGFGVIEHLRAAGRSKPAVIVATAADPVSLRKLDSVTVHSIVRKPFEIDMLGDLVTAAAASIERERELHPAGNLVQLDRRVS
jgi:CheY-like chemotaxis protein